MTELETHLLDALKRLEAQYQSRDQTFADKLKALSTQLELLSRQLNDLAVRIERLHTTMTQP